jgi:hypothetical protein
MSTPRILVALAATVTLLVACDTHRSDPYQPQVGADKGVVAVWPTTGPDTSVPSADSVFAPLAEAAKIDSPGGRTNASLTDAQETRAMPMPGQANDHSAPLAPAKPASAP